MNQNHLQFDSKPLHLKLSLSKHEYKKGEEILIDLAIKNKGKNKQKLIFEAKSAFPWATQATLINVETKKSAVKWQRSVISSQIYFEHQLTNYYFLLNPGKSTNKKCKLSDIVVFDSDNYTLPKGSYELKIFYYNNCSNSLSFKVI